MNVATNKTSIIFHIVFFLVVKMLSRMEMALLVVFLIGDVDHTLKSYLIALNRRYTGDSGLEIVNHAED